MRNLFAVPWLALGRRTLLSIVAAVILVFGIFALLKIDSGGKHTPVKELITGSIPKSPGRTASSNVPLASFLAPVLSDPARCIAPQWIEGRFRCRDRDQTGCDGAFAGAL